MFSIDLDDPSIEWVNRDDRMRDDPLGHVFKGKDGYYYRAIHRERLGVARDILGSGVLDRLAERQLIPHQEISEIEHPTYGMLMRAEAARWSVKVRDYPLDAIKASALVWLEINQELLTHGFGLVDGHPGNFVMFDGCVPKWIDIGSIVPLAGRSELLGIDSFRRELLHPLVVLARKEGTARPQVFKRDGLSLEEMSQLLGSGTGGIEEHTGRRQSLEALAALARSLEPIVPTNKWSGYRNLKVMDRVFDHDKIGAKEDQRDHVIMNLVRGIKPREILDVGANKGYHASLFASLGFPVLGIDTDEFSVNQFYGWARKHPELKLCAAFGDFATATHQADTVVSLALVHHLTFTAKLTFEMIAQRYAEMTQRMLVVEFMPNGLGVKGDVRPKPLPAHYTLDNFLRALSGHFEPKVIDYPRPSGRSPRILIQCRRT